MYGGLPVKIQSFLSSALDGVVWSGLWPGRSTPRGKSPRYPLAMRLGDPDGNVDVSDVFTDSIFRLDLSRAIVHLYVRI
jgi:hypothetical protein